LEPFDEPERPTAPAVDGTSRMPVMMATGTT